MIKRYKKIECNDGFEISVQASSLAYCYPRNNVGPYEEVELGYPSEQEHLIVQYAEDRNNLTNTVYPSVPVDVVLTVIKKHGGIHSGELPPLAAV